jgi:hypothetical protein
MAAVGCCIARKKTSSGEFLVGREKKIRERCGKKIDKRNLVRVGPTRVAACHPAESCFA